MGGRVRIRVSHDIDDAHNDYIFVRELPSGKGFADIVLIPRKNVDCPTIVIELKYNQNADTAIDQIPVIP